MQYRLASLVFCKGIMLEGRYQGKMPRVSVRVLNGGGGVTLASPPPLSPLSHITRHGFEGPLVHWFGVQRGVLWGGCDGVAGVLLMGDWVAAVSWAAARAAGLAGEPGTADCTTLPAIAGIRAVRAAAVSAVAAEARFLCLASRDHR